MFFLPVLELPPPPPPEPPLVLLLELPPPPLPLPSLVELNVLVLVVLVPVCQFPSFVEVEEVNFSLSGLLESVAFKGPPISGALKKWFVKFLFENIFPMI